MRARATRLFSMNRALEESGSIENQSLRIDISYSMFQKPTVCQGMTSVVPKKSRRSPGFSPCGTEADFRQSIFETRSEEIVRPVSYRRKISYACCPTEYSPASGDMHILGAETKVY